MSFYSTVCHQMESRSLTIHGRQIAVCERCSGVYFGFLGGSLTLLFFPGLAPRNGRMLMVMALTPLLLDVAAGLSGIHVPGPETRIATGLWFGMVAGLVLPPVAVGGMLEWSGRRSSLFPEVSGGC